MTNDENEKLTRYLTIGHIFYEIGQLDSARVYMERVFEENKNITSRIQAAECLCKIYDKKDNKRWDDCIHFLAVKKETEGKNKALISQLDGSFQNYLNRKQKKHVTLEKHANIIKTAKIVASVALFVIVLLGVISLRIHKKALTKVRESEQKRHTETIESEMQSFEREKSALSGRLRESNLKLRELREQVRQQEKEILNTDRAVSLIEEPIYKLIMARVKEGNFKSKVNCIYYKEYVLDKGQIQELRIAVDHHFNQLTTRLKKTYPELTKTDIDYCCLYLLGLTDADVAALMQRAYNTVSERSSRLRKIFGSENRISVTLRSIADNNAID